MLAPHLANLARSKAAFAAIAAVVTLGCVGTALAFTGDETDSAPQPPPSAVSRDTSAGTSTESAPAGQVVETRDPAAFAVSVAQVLFSWDTTESTPPNEYTGRLLAVADPSGEESAGLATDLTTYLPSPESWEDLKTYETRQWIDITSYEVPDGWHSARDNTKRPDIAAGTTAYTITGLRRRSGIWQRETAKTVDKVSFTILMTCKPTYDTCRLLRLPAEQPAAMPIAPRIQCAARPDNPSVAVHRPLRHREPAEPCHGRFGAAARGVEEPHVLRRSGRSLGERDATRAELGEGRPVGGPVGRVGPA